MYRPFKHCFFLPSLFNNQTLNYSKAEVNSLCENSKFLVTTRAINNDKQIIYEK